MPGAAANRSLRIPHLPPRLNAIPELTPAQAGAELPRIGPR